MSGDLDLGRPTGAFRGVRVTSAPLWRIRLIHSLPRWLVSLAAFAGLFASARFAVAPPRGAAAPSFTPSAPAPDRAAEGYAVLFARRYLSWDAAEPQTSDLPLESMAGSAMALGAGLSLPAAGAQRVAWAEVVQEREQQPGAHVYTVAAQTDGLGLVYLAVGVAREADGSLVLSSYPAFVGPPAHRGAQFPPTGPQVTDGGLTSVVRRALRNYLAAVPDELDADLSSDARVAVPSVALTLDSVQSIAWSNDHHSLVTIIQAHDLRGTHYTLGYELDVTDVHSRWEISAVGMDPEQ